MLWLVPSSPELGWSLRPGQGQLIPQRPLLEHPRAGSAPAPPYYPLQRLSSFLGRPGQDRDLGVGGCQISGLTQHLPDCFLL